MNETLDYLRTFAQFPPALRRFLRHRITLAEAQATVRQRMDQREDNFVGMVERSVYGNPRSPYLPLLKQAGCELSDVQALVKAKRLEGALQHLRAAGVYVTFEEFKGRQPIRRGGVELAVRSKDFDNPAAARDMLITTGGSTGTAQSVAMDLDHIAARAPHRLIMMSAHGLLDAPSAIWHGTLPAGGGRVILFGAKAGLMPKRWFTPIGLRDSSSWLKYGLATYYQLLCLRLAGARAPLPEFVAIDQPLAIARWMEEQLKQHGKCLLRAGPSRGVRLCLAAMEAGIDLTGATLTGGGEPATPAKTAQMARAGAKFVSNYGMTEAGQPGTGCAHGVDGSDVHLFKDAFALFSHPYPVEGFAVDVPAFNLTALLPTAPKVMLNVQLDDYGIVEERSCGCELETYGFTTHLRQIRSYSKLTGEGVTLIGNELMRVLEEVLPARFGGSPLDYQFMEEEDAQGLTKLYLTIHPRVAIADEREVIECVLDGLGRSSSMADAARVVWKNAATIQIRRAEPAWTGRGKMPSLHVSRPPAA